MEPCKQYRSTVEFNFIDSAVLNSTWGTRVNAPLHTVHTAMLERKETRPEPKKNNVCQLRNSSTSVPPHTLSCRTDLLVLRVIIYYMSFSDYEHSLLQS